MKIMLDKDLAELYHVTTGNLNKAVKRNIRRFPSDFMFQLTKDEWDSLRFQFGIIENGRGKYNTSFQTPCVHRPLVFIMRDKEGVKITCRCNVPRLELQVP